MSRNHLTIKQKAEVLHLLDQKVSTRVISDKFHIGASTISRISRNRSVIMEALNKNDNVAEIKHLGKFANCGREIDEVLLEWYNKARGRKIPVSGPLLQEKALLIATKLGQTDFKASNGWLESFKRRHSISFRVLTGESNSLNMTEVTAWADQLRGLCSGYAKENIFNCDETGR